MSLFGRNDREGGDRTTVGGAVASPATAPSRAAGAPGGPRDEMANIGKSITIKGDLTGNEDLVIEGNVEGKVDLPNNQLTIGEAGKVSADLHAKAVVVIGRVAGNVHATERVQIESSGVVEGDVHSPRLILEEGAVLNGSVVMGKKAATAAPPTPAPP